MPLINGDTGRLYAQVSVVPFNQESNLESNAPSIIIVIRFISSYFLLNY